MIMQCNKIVSIFNFVTHSKITIEKYVCKLNMPSTIKQVLNLEHDL